MPTVMLIDATTPFGARVTTRLRDETVIWLVTTRPDGTPEPSPVWFYWDGETFLIYSLRDTVRERNLARRPRVALHFDSARGSDVVIFTGEASIEESAPPAHANPAYAEKYRADFTRIRSTPEQFSLRYSLPIRVRPTKLRGH
ncbi:MAG: TIGR03667 family PPOX class F420-dependent oxidoreductase [Chloroflexi bacterium]|nr:TIGR03667 family PPOX class F420-dependent oxidoreductase [Chloroflexota bacterium]